MFWKMSLREMQNRPVRTILTLLSVVLGATAVVSVALTTATVRQAQAAMFSALSGQTDLVITAEGNATFDLEIVETVRSVAGVRVAVPTMNRSTILYAGDYKAKTQILGTIPELDSSVRNYLVVEGEMPKTGNTFAIDERLAKSLHIEVSDTVKMLSRSGIKEWRVTGLLRHQGGAALAQSGILFAPLKTVQTQFRAKDKIDKIEILVQDVSQRAEVHKAIAALLPVGVMVKEPAEDNQFANQTMNAAELGLRLATTFALMIAVFIIFNTFQMVVGERRRQLGIMRAIGATRKQIIRYILGEAVFVGAIGTLIGSFVGTAGAFLLMRATQHVLQSEMPDPQITFWPFAVAVLFGVGIAWIGAYLPARRAGALSPLEAMQSLLPRDMESSNYIWPIIGGLLTITGGSMHAGCILGYLDMNWTILASSLILFGVVFLLPTAVEPTTRIVQWLLSPILGIEAKLAYRQLLRHRSRTSMTTSVLFIAIAFVLGLGLTIMDNIRNIDVWCSRAIVGDFFVRAAMPDMSTGRSADLPDSVGDALRKVKGIRVLEPLRFVSARTGDNSIIVVIRNFQNSEGDNFDIVQGKRDEMFEGLRTGGILIGSVLSERLKLNLGDMLNMETLEGPQKLKVAGVVNDYLAGGLTAYMDRAVAEKYFHVEGQDAYVIQAEPNQLAAVEQEVSRICTEEGLLFQSNADLVEMIRSMSRGVNGGLWGLLALGAAIASFGLINTLTMNIIEQTREIGLLRTVAMTRRQIRRMVFAQALLLGIVGFVPGTVMGVVIAYLINLSMYTATGHVIEIVFRPWVVFGSLGIALTLSLLASMIPAERAARIRIGEALGYQ